MADIPKIRFKGFTEPWEQRKLEAVLYTFERWYSWNSINDVRQKGPYLLSAKNIKNGQIIIDDSSDRKISEDEFNQIHTKVHIGKRRYSFNYCWFDWRISNACESAGKFTFQR